MADLLVKLYDLGDDWSFMRTQSQKGITLRKPLGTEYRLVVDWVGEHFNRFWPAETERALSNQPVSCFIAVRPGKLIGFGCYDATALGYFGPVGVDENHRGQGTGKALLMACLLAMKLQGYGYAVIGKTGLEEFYNKACGAVPIPGSSPGLYRTWVKPPEG